MEEIKLVVDKCSAGKRIDVFVTEALGEGYSRTYVKYLINEGFISVNVRKVKPHYVVGENDDVAVSLAPRAEPEDVEPEDIPLDIIYEDEWVIVVNKPAGMVVHPAAGNRRGTLVAALLHHCGALPDDISRMRPGIVHRLDKDTSGVIVAAKNDRAMRSLAKQFQRRAVKKRYLALVKGSVEMDNGVINAPLARHMTDRKKMDVEYTGGREAETAYHVLQRFNGFTFLRLEPKTGRTHQIRVHMKHIGHPLLGDKTYGGKDNMPRQALHAEMLAFTHPDSGKYMEFTAPMPHDMLEFLKKNTDGKMLEKCLLSYKGDGYGLEDKKCRKSIKR